MSADIVLATINARYHHASLGLRYLFANLGELKPRAVLEEFTLESRPADIAERILAHRPRVVGLGVYIWNVDLSGAVAALIKTVDPDCIVVMGGPETGFEDDLPEAAASADYIIAGQGDLAFADLCRSLLDGAPPAARFIRAANPPLAGIEMPYAFYDANDIAHRMIYVEASRGCPFTCAFCLSSLDRTAWRFGIERVLAELDSLYRRGVRQFKFVDRTFNLERSTAAGILDYFLGLDDPELFLHFELVPDRLPEAVKSRLARFAPGALQLEIGIQTFNPETQDLISRRQDNAKTRANLAWLRAHTHAHLHTDLIFGLPGEDLASFALGFNALFALRPHEIQVGILKRLRGTPLIRLEQAFAMRFNPSPPYDILSSDRVDFATTQRMRRFARYYDMIANSGRFARTMALFEPARAFEDFMTLADAIFADTGKTHRIALPKLFEQVERGLTGAVGMNPVRVQRALADDFDHGRYRGAHRPDAVNPERPGGHGHGARQARHAAVARRTTTHGGNG